MNKKITFTIILLILLLSVNSVLAEQKTCVYFFHGDGCQHCAKVEPMLDSLNANVELHKFEIYSNRTNLLLLNQYYDKYNISENQRGIPALFIGENYYLGDAPILNNIDQAIIENQGANCPTTDLQKKELTQLSLLTIIGAAIVDSINPCAIAVLLILLGTLLATKDKKRTMRAGLAFTLSIYISYFLFGIGLFSALQITGISYWFYKIIGILAIIIGLANIKDYIWYGAGGFVMEIPRSWRPALKNLLSKVTSPLGAFIIGFVVCLFELPCTGGPYLVILGLLAEKTTLLSAIPSLLLYNLVFVLPLLIITFAIYFGYSNVSKATEWKDKNLRILHLVAGIIMLALGIIITLGLI
ncbi:hypothetical protein COV13_03605 [Candidatus Woesearchaeota archaeon CG10_big_fil_rev_8_21_14_0_10_32_9]|nr:MAG: hypothetical protein COV13_03605 [Candidatus Woesearchaeota archaeon CG10_big_fil_rev_8_21_14_0_10_32_9]